MRVGAALLLLLLLAATPALADPPRADIPSCAIQPHIVALTAPAMDGRLSGTRGNERAAQYIARWFRQVGLKPVGTSRERDPAAPMDGSGYYQPFPIEMGHARGPHNHLTVTAAGRAFRLRPGRDYDPAPGSTSGTAAGDVVFAGCGQPSGDPKRDDYAGVDVKGKVVLAFCGVPADGKLAPVKYPERKAVAARERGAVALLLVADRDIDSPVPTHMTHRNAQMPVVMLRRTIAARLLRCSGLSLDALQASALAGPCARRTGLAVDLQDDRVPRVRITANIVGMLPGSDPALRGQVVVIGAHMDHLGHGFAGALPDDTSTRIHPGADDNASGAAAVTALAQHFAAMRERPRRSLLFICFSGEEEGLYGSRYYVSHPIVPLERTEAMINLDMVGRLQNDHLYLNGAGTSPAWHPMVDQLDRTACFNIGYMDSAGGGSDHLPFAERKVPVLFFFSGMHPDYHRPTDTADKIDRLDEARIVSLVADVAARLAWQPARIAWNDQAATARR